MGESKCGDAFPLECSDMVGRQEGICVGLLSMMMQLELCTSYSSSCHHHLRHPHRNKIQNGGFLYRLTWVVLENGH